VRTQIARDRVDGLVLFFDSDGECWWHENYLPKALALACRFGGNSITPPCH
jgi:hypothetical protein